jgi:hypothetical protein
VGRFAVVASTNTVAGSVAAIASSAVSVGKTQQQWIDSPLASFDSVLHVFADKQTYHAGANVILSFYNPLPSAKALVVMGSPVSSTGGAASTPSALVSLMSVPAAPGPTTLVVTLDDHCGANCMLTVVLSSAASPVLPVPVPTSVLLDVTSGRVLQHSVPITIVQESGPAAGQPLGTLPHAVVSLWLSTDSDTNIAQPGQTVNVTVTLTDSDGSALSGEVMLVVVDKAMLDLKPVKLQDVSSLFTPSRSTGGAEVRESRAIICNNGVYLAVALLLPLLLLSLYCCL